MTQLSAVVADHWLLPSVESQIFFSLLLLLLPPPLFFFFFIFFSPPGQVTALHTAQKISVGRRDPVAG